MFAPEIGFKNLIYFYLFIFKNKIRKCFVKKKNLYFQFNVSNEKNYQWYNIRPSFMASKKRDVCRPTLPPRVSLSPDQLLLWWDTPAIQWSIEWLVFFLYLFVFCPCLFSFGIWGRKKKWQSVKSSGCSLSLSRVVGTGSYSISMLKPFAAFCWNICCECGSVVIPKKEIEKTKKTKRKKKKSKNR